MPKFHIRQVKRIKNLVTVSALTAIILVVSTFAWFVGMRTVNVSSFDIEIASTDSLLLSLDGEKFEHTVTISQATLNDVSYDGHTNSWGGRGLIPMSSVGEMDPESSRLVLYEKASFTATPGGYRIMSSRVNNYENGRPEQEGYVAFDLFIKNFSGTKYIPELNQKDEEAIYLTTDSEVSVAAGGVSNTGIENSVRVAFGQVGRVIGSSKDVELITGISCSPLSGSGVTGICRPAQIWEPNDTEHTENAINWYKASCFPRIDVDLTLKTSYNTQGTCGNVVNGTAYPTYAVSREISSEDEVDIYDGPAYNGYVPTAPTVSPLYAFPYFTDEHKLLTGTDRPTFMTLAPNSITKVRIYVYIEGQDIDNYDFASIGKKISVKFGFTKERFTEDDFGYDGPPIDPEEI
ncbi:MAG: hypothetical protein GX236_07685 [Clostridiaceae bacterium]|jgi:hypothetical protein|nr:hypothetical protein [Clostridiaceae bacterium]